MDRLKKIAMRIAITGGVLTFAAINSVPILTNDRIRKSKHYKQALELLSSHPEAIKYLGEPITGRRVNVTKKENYGADDKKMWLKVPVVGPKGKGILFYNFIIDNYSSDSFQLSQVELTVDQFKDQKLIIKYE